MLCNMSIIISRILTRELSYFGKTFNGVVVRHIKHIHHKDMSSWSDTVSIPWYYYFHVIYCFNKVPLGVILKNENVIEEMIEVLLQLLAMYQQNTTLLLIN